MATCTHKHRLTLADKIFLKVQKIEPYDCATCEKISLIKLKVEPPKKT